MTPSQEKLVLPRHVERLYKAVANYVEKNGGTAVVVGGIAIQQWPTDAKMCFHVAVKCTGRKPVFKKRAKATKNG